jgi:PAS domain S-box-containing protein
MSEDPAGSITHFVAVKQDVTERHRAEEALRHSEEYHRSLLDNALDLIVVLDGDAIVRYASPSVERVLGYRPDEMVGTSTLGRLHPDDLARVSELLRTGRTTPGFTASVEYRIRHKDGSYRMFEAVASSLLHHPAVAGIIVNARDVTERKQAEEAQERLRQHLRRSEKLAAMGELLAGVAHELNNALSVVIGHTALLARAHDPVVVGRAEKIGRAAERCGRIVKNFLALARQYPPERTSVSLNQIVRDAVEVLAYPLRVDDVEVTMDLAEDLSLLAADCHQLQQVIVNLVTNAHQALRSRNDSRRLTLCSGTGPAGFLWLEVSDTGPGIPPRCWRGCSSRSSRSSRSAREPGWGCRSAGASSRVTAAASPSTGGSGAVRRSGSSCRSVEPSPPSRSSTMGRSGRAGASWSSTTRSRSAT